MLPSMLLSEVMVMVNARMSSAVHAANTRPRATRTAAWPGGHPFACSLTYEYYSHILMQAHGRIQPPIRSSGSTLLLTSLNLPKCSPYMASTS